MNLLVSGNRIVAIAEKITFGIYDEDIEKWRLADENDNLMYYMVDSNFELVENVTLPEDYEGGKYFYENGEFVLNESWKPFIPQEKRLEILEEQVAIHEENDAELLYQICLLQLGITEDELIGEEV